MRIVSRDNSMDLVRRKSGETTGHVSTIRGGEIRKWHMTKSHAVVTFQDEVGEIQPADASDNSLSPNNGFGPSTSAAKISFNSG